MSSIQLSAQILKDVLSRKNRDYAGNVGEFYNFQRTAEFAKIAPFDVMLAQIGIKFTRIENLNVDPEIVNNESLKDSLLDLAGYAIIAHAYLSAREAEQDGCKRHPMCDCLSCA